MCLLADRSKTSSILFGAPADNIGRPVAKGRMAYQRYKTRFAFYCTSDAGISESRH